MWCFFVWLCTRYPLVSNQVFRFSAFSVLGTAMSFVCWSLHTMLLYYTGMFRLSLAMPLWEMHLVNILFNTLMILLCGLLVLTYPPLVYCAVGVMYTVVGCTVEIGVRVKRRRPSTIAV